MGFFGGSSVDLTSPGPIGSITPNTGAFTTIGVGTTPSGSTKLSVLGTSDTTPQIIFNGAQWFGSVDGNQGVLYQGDIAGKVKVIALNQAFTAYKTLELVSDGNTFSFPSTAGTLVVSSSFSSPPAIGSTTPNTGSFTTLNTGNGAAATPSLKFSGSGGANAGLFYLGPAVLVCHYNNPQIGFDDGANVRVHNGGSFAFSSNTSPLGTLDTILKRDASNTLALRNSTNAQTFRIYNTFTDASNYERGFMRWATNVLEIGAEAAGTGTQRTLVLKVGSTNALTITTSGQANFISRVQADNFSIGGNFIYVDPISNGFRIVDSSGSTSASGGLFLYNSYTNTTNNERGFVRWGSNRFQVGTISIGTGTARTCEVTFYASASDPTSADITSGYFSVWKNTGSGTVKLWVNDGGTMKSVALA